MRFDVEPVEPRLDGDVVAAKPKSVTLLFEIISSTPLPLDVGIPVEPPASSFEKRRNVDLVTIFDRALCGREGLAKVVERAAFVILLQSLQVGNIRVRPLVAEIDRPRR